MIGPEHDAVAQIENEPRVGRPVYRRPDQRMRLPDGHGSHGSAGNGHATQTARRQTAGMRERSLRERPQAKRQPCLKLPTIENGFDTADIHAAVASKCIHELFEAQVDLRPANVALKFRDESWSYQEVEERANQLARQLRARGVGPGKLVGVYFSRSEKPVISILATLKAGAGYVPIDSGYPPERVRHIVEEAEVAVLLDGAGPVGRGLRSVPGRALAIDTDARTIGAESRERLSRAETGVSPSDLAYILFTSGTTGRPKGVMIEHRNVVGFATSLNKILKMGPTDRVYQGFSLGFDASVEELWMAFTNGGALVVSPPDVVRVPDEVVQVHQRTPVHVHLDGADVSVDPRHRHADGAHRDFRRRGVPARSDSPLAVPGRRVINTYGPTETTVDATFVECKVDEPVTIGIPLPAYTAYVLDENSAAGRAGRAG